jgi:hypothetical protein
MAQSRLKEIAFDYGHLGIIGIDDTSLRQYLGYVYPRTICWSNDKSKLAFETRGCCAPNLWILDLLFAGWKAIRLLAQYS